MPETNTIKKSKKIGEVFSDYKTNSNIVDAEITKMNLIKKINTLEIGMHSKEYIEIKAEEADNPSIRISPLEGFG